MFEKALAEKLKRIFGIPKVTFHAPSEDFEQETLFIGIDTSRNQIKDGLQIARATGRLRIFATQDQLPFGYFSKRIAEADSEDTIDFFFFDFEENSPRFLNISERSVGFVFFYKGQYNPEVGEMNEINFQVQVSE